MIETKIRSFIKTVFWRVIATLNSYFILLYLNDQSHSNFKKAVYMNISGFFVYYVYERMWNRIKWQTTK